MTHDSQTHSEPPPVAKENALAQLARVFSRSYAEIFFLQGGFVGAVLCFITLVNPRVGLAGLLSVLAAYGFARLIRMDRVFLESGYYTYNPVLVGLSLGELFQLTPLTAFFIVVAGVLTLLVTISLANIFSTYLRLPILSLPFVIVSAITHIASLRYSNLLLNATPPTGWRTWDLGMPDWAAWFFKSWGALLFTPSVIVGVVLCVVVLCRSRILFLLGLVGYIAGTTMRHFMLGSVTQAFSDPLNFNFTLIAMAVGGVFLVPLARSYLIAIIAVVMSTLVMDAITGFWSYTGVPAYTLPFNIVALGLIYVLGLVGDSHIARRIGRTPEETLEDYLAGLLRYPGSERTLLPPFAGRWTVWQGFDGKWTHKGAWRYGYDFVITGDDEKTHINSGERVEDFYCFNKPVLAPVRGRVIHIVNDLPDNPIGQPDKINNWGNLVVIHDPRGFHVALAHFAKESIRVKAGDWVERGAVLGKCGNSGYSPQPHLHVQAQLADAPGAASVPFSFVSYSEDGMFHANDLPQEDHVIEPLYANKRLETVTNFALDEEYSYSITRDGKSAGEFRLVVKMALDGSFYFDSGHGQLYFSRHEGTFYFHRVDGDDLLLREFLLALPRMPLAQREGLMWEDYLPASYVAGVASRWLLGLLSSIRPQLATAKATQRFHGDNLVETTIESRLLGVKRSASVEFDRCKGIARIISGNLTLERITNDKDNNHHENRSDKTTDAHAEAKS